jgi:hypothetical protein
MVVLEQIAQARVTFFWSADILVSMSAKREESLSSLGKLRRAGMPALQPELLAQLFTSLRHWFCLISRDRHRTTFMMTGAEELAPIQNLLLELFQVEIDNRRDEQRDELRDYQATDYDQTEWPPRRAIGAVP